MPLSFVLCHAAQRLVFGAVTEEREGGLSLVAPEGVVEIRKHQVLLRWEDAAARAKGGREALQALVEAKRAALEAEAARLPLAAASTGWPIGL